MVYCQQKEAMNSFINIESAEYIKVKLIDYYLSLYHKNNIIIGNEVMYGITRKVVDLVLLKNNGICAIEIKSEKDNLKRLDNQIVEYKNNFNSVIICTTEKHLDEIRKKITPSIGILLFKNDSILSIRKPTVKKRLSKIDTLHSIPGNYLRKLTDISYVKKMDSDQIRKHFEKLSFRKVQSIYFKYMESRLIENYRLFLTDKGHESHVDDLPLLSLKSTKIDII